MTFKAVHSAISLVDDKDAKTADVWERFRISMKDFEQNATVPPTVSCGPYRSARSTANALSSSRRHLREIGVALVPASPARWTTSRERAALSPPSPQRGLYPHRRRHSYLPTADRSAPTR